MRAWKISDVNLKSTGTTVIVPAMNGVKFVVGPAPIVVIKTIDTVGVYPTVSIGTSNTFNNITAATAIATVTAAEQIFNLSVVGVGTKVRIDLTNNPIYLNVSIGATATTLTADVYIFGVLD